MCASCSWNCCGVSTAESTGTPVSVDSQRQAFEQFLKTRALKLTSQRRRIFDRAFATHGHFSAETLYGWLRDEPGARVSRATVYRTLEILEQMGTIRRVHLEDGCEAFAPTAIEHGHYLICANCQTTIEFEGCDLGQMLNRVAAQTGFKIEQHWLELVGQCPKCQKKK